MKKCIGFGGFNKYYVFILLYIIVALFNNSLIGINYYTGFNELKIIRNGNFENFILIHQLFYCYFGTMLLSFLFYIFHEKKMYDENESDSSNSLLKIDSINSRASSKIVLIHRNDIKETNKKFSSFYFLIIILGWTFEEQVIEKYDCTLSHLDFYMFELIIISYLNSKIFKLKIYQHHRFVIYLCLFPIILKIITIFLVFIGDEKVIYKDHWYLIPIGLLIYFPLITLKSYILIKIKWLMDLKYYTPNKLLMIYGLTGTLFYLIICTFSTFIKNKNTDIWFINEENSFSKYFSTFKNTNLREKIFEILGIILGIISSYYVKYFFISIIKNLTPVHIIFLSPIYYFFFKLILIIYNIIYCFIKKDFQSFFSTKDMKYLVEKFILDISGDIVSFIGFLIYLEIVVLKFCKLDYNIRKSIINRGILESLEVEDVKSPDAGDEIKKQETKESLLSQNNISDNLENVN